MVDTVRTLSANQTLLADNTAGDISPQDVRDFLVSVYPTAPQVARVETEETRASAGYGDLATSGPAVTVTVGSNGLLSVSIFCSMWNSDLTAAGAAMGFALSGANTLAAADARTVLARGDGIADWHHGATFMLTGLNAGSTTITAKYSYIVNATASFRYREISAHAYAGVFS